MSTFPYKTAKELQAIADGNSGLPDDSGGMSLPFVDKSRGTLQVVFFFYGTAIGGGQYQIFPAHHVMRIDPLSGAVTQLAASQPRDFGLTDNPNQPLSSVVFDPRPDPDAARQFARIDRFMEISPRVWSAYASGKVAPDMKPVLKEYLQLFTDVAKVPLVRYYKAIGADFFTWLDGAAK